VRALIRRRCPKLTDDASMKIYADFFDRASRGAWSGYAWKLGFAEIDELNRAEHFALANRAFAANVFVPSWTKDHKNRGIESLREFRPFLLRSLACSEGAATLLLAQAAAREFERAPETLLQVLVEESRALRLLPAAEASSACAKEVLAAPSHSYPLVESFFSALDGIWLSPEGVPPSLKGKIASLTRRFEAEPALKDAVERVRRRYLGASAP
jgi:hypothetical protein